MLMCVFNIRRGRSTKLSNKIRILRKMELTRFEETKSDATISITNNVLKKASRESCIETSKMWVG
ncbi:MAG: hypothetical protein KBA21_05175, partial [Mesotoga sp.]|nr:hypothetical protein [Mesotoga sp.]